MLTQIAGSSNAITDATFDRSLGRLCRIVRGTHRASVLRMVRMSLR